MTLSYTKHQNYHMIKAQKQILSGLRMSLGILLILISLSSLHNYVVK